MTSTPAPDDDLESQALFWVVRTCDTDFTDWEAFERWMSADPTHAAAYQSTADAERHMVEVLAQAPAEVSSVGSPTVPPRPAFRRSAAWLGGALAASLVLAVGIGTLRSGQHDTVYETGSGQRREIALAEGSRVVLNGDTRISYAAGAPRAVRLDRGEALFTVRHDASRPFSVAVGDAKIVDLGTEFDVVRTSSTTRVEVARGTVLWNPDREGVRLDAGRSLAAEDGGGTVRLSSVAAASVGGWTQGQLSYDGAPLSRVAEDLSRSLGISVSVSPEVASRPVRGVLRLDGGAGTVVPRLAVLLGIRARHDGAAWRLTPSP